MKVDVEGLKENINSILGQTSGWLAVPFDKESEFEHSKTATYFIYYSFDDGCISLDYSEDGMRFKASSDWGVDLYPDGKFKGKGSTRHKERIVHTINWFVKIANDENFHYLLMKSPH